VFNISTFSDKTDIYAIIHFVPHPYQHITVDQSHSSGDTVAKIPVISRQREYLSQTPRRKSHTGLNLGSGVATALRVIFLPCASYPTLWQNLFETPCRSFCASFSKNLEKYILYRRKNYHDPMHSLFVVNF
jgi:hypothetical protein